LSYSSGGGDGFVGVGWSLSGFSTIQRVSPGHGTPAYNDSTDVFLLDGAELVPCVSGSLSPSCTTGGTHSTQIESYLRIVHNVATNSWQVTQKSVRVSTYQALFPSGSTGASTYRWGLASVADTRANSVNYGWWCDGANDCYPSSVV